jgi:hypothetical protein
MGVSTACLALPRTLGRHETQCGDHEHNDPRGQAAPGGRVSRKLA